MSTYIDASTSTSRICAPLLLKYHVFHFKCCLYQCPLLLLQEVPNEVLQVGNSLRTLDLTNNKLGNQILFIAVCYIQCSMDKRNFVF
jgi:hypothetical protein